VLQEPFLSTNASNTVATTSFGGTQDAGTTVTVTPQIAEGDHLVLEYSLSLSTFVGESSDPSLPPPRQQNNLQSVVTVPDGYTIVVGGLEVETTADAVSQVPLLGDLPLVGELFKSRSKSSSLSRFYLFVRANILRHDGFEDLKFLSDRDVLAAGVDDGWPAVEPRVIR
jgi:general secretion pathway protein D